MANKVKALQNWCRQQCQGYRDVDIINMTTSWRDGLAFCAIIHRYHPELINYDSLKKEDIYENNKLAFTVGEKLGISPFLDAEDMVTLKVPDRLSIITYVSQYYNIFSKQKPTPTNNTLTLNNISTIKRPASESNENEDSLKKPKPAALNGEKRLTRMNSVTDDNTCALCHEKVYLLERHIDKDKLYHRSCFRNEQKSLFNAKQKEFTNFERLKKVDGSSVECNMKDVKETETSSPCGEKLITVENPMSPSTSHVHNTNLPSINKPNSVKKDIKDKVIVDKLEDSCKNEFKLDSEHESVKCSKEEGNLSPLDDKNKNNKKHDTYIAKSEFNISNKLIDTNDKSNNNKMNYSPKDIKSFIKACPKLPIDTKLIHLSRNSLESKNDNSKIPTDSISPREEKKLNELLNQNKSTKSAHGNLKPFRSAIEQNKNNFSMQNPDINKPKDFASHDNECKKSVSTSISDTLLKLNKLESERLYLSSYKYLSSDNKNGQPFNPTKSTVLLTSDFDDLKDCESRCLKSIDAMLSGDVNSDSNSTTTSSKSSQITVITVDSLSDNTQRAFTVSKNDQKSVSKSECEEVNTNDHIRRYSSSDKLQDSPGMKIMRNAMIENYNGGPWESEAKTNSMEDDSNKKIDDGGDGFVKVPLNLTLSTKSNLENETTNSSSMYLTAPTVSPRESKNLLNFTANVKRQNFGLPSEEPNNYRMSSSKEATWPKPSPRTSQYNSTILEIVEAENDVNNPPQHFKQPLPPSLLPNFTSIMSYQVSDECIEELSVANCHQYKTFKNHEQHYVSHENNLERTLKMYNNDDECNRMKLKHGEAHFSNSIDSNLLRLKTNAVIYDQQKFDHQQQKHEHDSKIKQDIKNVPKPSKKQIKQQNEHQKEDITYYKKLPKLNQQSNEQQQLNNEYELFQTIKWHIRNSQIQSQMLEEGLCSPILNDTKPISPKTSPNSSPHAKHISPNPPVKPPRFSLAQKSVQTSLTSVGESHFSDSIKPLTTIPSYLTSTHNINLKPPIPKKPMPSLTTLSSTSNVVASSSSDQIKSLESMSSMTSFTTNLTSTSASTDSPTKPIPISRHKTKHLNTKVNSFTSYQPPPRPADPPKKKIFPPRPIKFESLDMSEFEDAEDGYETSKAAEKDILQNLQQIDKKLKIIEGQGRDLEQLLRKDENTSNEDQHMLKWFELIDQRNELVREETDLIYKFKQLQLERDQANTDAELRGLMCIPESRKTQAEKKLEEYLLSKLVDLVSLRSNIVDNIEDDRLRYIKEDEALKRTREISLNKKNQNKEKKKRKSFFRH